MKISAHYYQQFDADFERDVPGEGYGGWKRAEIDISPEHTALVVMHAWDTGARDECPGWHRCVEFIPRAEGIVREVFPPLLDAVRKARMPVFHVVGGSNHYYEALPGYLHARMLGGASVEPEQVADEPALLRLREFRERHVFVGEHNQADVIAGFGSLDFPSQARPLPTEGVAESSEQLFALCKETGVNHLIYIGSAINWCLLLSPGGMADMSKHGLLCSTLSQAVTAVENRETAREELCKQLALWRVAVAFGFVFDVPDFLAAIQPL